MVVGWVRCVPVATMILSGLFAAACSGGASGADRRTAEARVSVVSTSNIVGEWVRRVGGDDVRVVDLLPPGADPHTFQPGARDIANIANADLVLSIGLDLEGQWLTDMIANVGGRRVDVLVLGPLADPIRTMDSGETGGGLDPHFWMDPVRVKAAVSAIAEQLAELDAEHGQEYRDNAEAYRQDLDELHSWIVGRLREVSQEDRILVTSHDSLGYFAARYGFRVIGSVIPGTSTERDPSASEMAALVDAIRLHRAKAIFVEASVSDRMARRISEEAGVPLVEGILVGSLGPPGSDTDTYEEMMRRNVEIIAEALRQP